MIEIKFYKNGFEINGHARIETCYEVSILAWFCASSIGTIEKIDWYTSDHDNSNVGYSHFVSELKEEKSRWMFSSFIEHLKYWSNFYKWESDSHIRITETTEMLSIPINFKEIKGIASQQNK